MSKAFAEHMRREAEKIAGEHLVVSKTLWLSIADLLGRQEEPMCYGLPAEAVARAALIMRKAGIDAYMLRQAVDSIETVYRVVSGLIEHEIQETMDGHKVCFKYPDLDAVAKRMVGRELPKIFDMGLFGPELSPIVKIKEEA